MWKLGYHPTPEEIRSKTKEEIISWYASTQWTSKPVVQPHEEEFFNGRLKTADTIGLDSSEAESYALGQLMGWRRDKVFAEQVISQSQRANRSKGGKGRKLLAEPQHKQWLKQLLKRHEGQKAKYKKISDSLFNEHDYQVGARTVRDRCTELGLLESA